MGRIRSVPPFFLVFIPLAAIYIATANLATHGHIDPLTNAVTGWHLGMSESVVLPEHADATSNDQRGNVAWVIDSRRGPVSQYPPGAAAMSAPLYRLSGEPMTESYVQGFNRPDTDPVPFPLPSVVPAAITAALATAAAMGFLAASVPLAGGSHSAAVAVGYVSGLGTTMWSTASDALWQHGPASMCIALGIYLVARSQLWWAGLAFGAAVITRPPTALIVATLGLWIAWTRRSVIPLYRIGLGSLAGLLGLLWYNHWLWGTVSVTGGYRSDFTARLASNDFASYAENILRGLADPSFGLFVYSPFLVVLVPGFRAAWRKLPDWGRAASIGALVYYLIHLKVNRASGGTGFLGYRYPLEALTAAGTLFALSYVHWVSDRPLVRKLFWGGVGVALSLQITWKLALVPIDGRTS